MYPTTFFRHSSPFIPSSPSFFLFFSSYFTSCISQLLPLSYSFILSSFPFFLLLFFLLHLIYISTLALLLRSHSVLFLFTPFSSFFTSCISELLPLSLLFHSVLYSFFFPLFSSFFTSYIIKLMPFSYSPLFLLPSFMLFFPVTNLLPFLITSSFLFCPFCASYISPSSPFLFLILHLFILLCRYQFFCLVSLFVPSFFFFLLKYFPSLTLTVDLLIGSFQ